MSELSRTLSVTEHCKFSNICSIPEDHLIVAAMGLNSVPRLRGRNLNACMVAFLVIPSFVLFGYCNGSTGGILDLPSFNKVSILSPFHRAAKTRWVDRVPSCSNSPSSTL